MNLREQMLGAITGRPLARIPWVPRMDLWCIANRARGTLPEGLDPAADEVGISAYLDVACHALGADHTVPRTPEQFALFGLGFESHPDFPYRLVLHDLPVKVTGTFDRMTSVITTRRGEVTTRMEWTDEMRRAGISVPMVQQQVVQTPDDLDVIAEIFEHIEVVPTPEGYRAYRARVGDRGLAVAQGPAQASPAHLMLHDLLSMESFFYLWADDRAAIDAFTRRLDPFYEAILAALTQCDAEVVWWGANFDKNITWPAFFEAEIVPWMRRASERLHGVGKLLLSHTDGENLKLLPLYPTSGFDIAQSVCPYPMTSLTLREVREGLAPEQALWGGIPSVALLPDSMDDAAFETFLDGLAEQAGTGHRLILSVSDMVPPDADMGRLRRIGERIEELGPPAAG